MWRQTFGLESQPRKHSLMPLFCSDRSCFVPYGIALWPDGDHTIDWRDHTRWLFLCGTIACLNSSIWEFGKVYTRNGRLTGHRIPLQNQFDFAVCCVPPFLFLSCFHERRGGARAHNNRTRIYNTSSGEPLFSASFFYFSQLSATPLPYFFSRFEYILFTPVCVCTTRTNSASVFLCI